MRICSALLVLVVMVAGAAAQPSQSADETAIRAVIAAWYSELQKVANRKHWQLYAPMAIDGGPGERELFPGKRSFSPTVSNELAARALAFAYEIDVLSIDTRFAKAIVWERGYFYAWANQETYENAARAVFVLEKQADGRWLILAHEANSTGIPDTKKTVPLPDMKARWEGLNDSPEKPSAAD